ncbi:nuclear transport factor 2 family protein [Streptomyces sp. NPDC058375]|uniref:nuclear transport factor 2 family protein n=1 Tax=Streptomyces sp. NPDC058375 TaxID=3346467 RepID=UPI00365C6633
MDPEVAPGTEPTPSVAELAARLAALTARVTELEDELAVRRLIASYGPTVDSGDAGAAGALWTQDAVYDMDVGVLNGSAGISKMVLGTTHQEIIGGGSAHNIGPALVEVEGGRATAVTYSQIFRGDGDGGFYVWRIAANRWDLVRNEAGWRIAGRLTRLLDGREEAREILGGAVR